MNRKTFCNEFSKSMLNLFSDFGKYKTIVSICDTVNFFIIKVDTENPKDYKEINYVDFFYNENKELFIGLDKDRINTINLIKTKHENLMEKFKFKFDINSQNYNSLLFDNHSIVCSDINEGIVNPNLEKFLLDLEKISKRISSNFIFSWCEYELEHCDGKFNILNFKSDSYYPNSKIESILLDNFELYNSNCEDCVLDFTVI